MSESNVASLAKTLQQTDGLERDFSQMFSSLRDTIEKEYLLKIRSAADREKAFAVEHPPREVTLLRALSAFTDENGKRQIERMTRSLLFLHSMQNVQKGLSEITTAGNLLETRSADTAGSPSADGALPNAHSAQMAGLFLLLALADQL